MVFIWNIQRIMLIFASEFTKTIYLLYKIYVIRMEITGKIISVLPEQKFNGKNGEIVKNSFVIEWQDNGYSQHLCLEVMGDKFEKMKNAVVVGHEVLCKFNVSSREYQNRWFTTANCFYCSTVGGTGQSNNGGQQQQEVQQPVQQQEDDSGLPF